MRAKEREAWPVRNIGKGGRRPTYDAFNKSMKGHERNPAAKEFASQGLEEYHHYSETQDTRNESNNQNSTRTSQTKKNNSSKVNRATNGIVKNLVTKVAMLAMGSVIVVNGYQTIKANEAPPIIPIVASTTWSWSDDNTATLDLIYDDDTHKVLKTVVTISTEDSYEATCTEDGKTTYVATAEDENGKTYTDTHTETLPKIGKHDYQVIKNTIEDGYYIHIEECTRCHDKNTTKIYVGEVE